MTMLLASGTWLVNLPTLCWTVFLQDSSVFRKFILIWNTELVMSQFDMTEVDRESHVKGLVQDDSLGKFGSRVGPSDFAQFQDVEMSLDSLRIGAESPEIQSQGNESMEEELFTKDLIQITRSSVDFSKNTLFPGSIQEIEVSVSLKQNDSAEDSANNSYFLRIVATCHNSEFNDLDQYVYSVRSTERFEYYDEVHFRIKKNERAEFKVAVKIPAVKEASNMDGTLSIQLENTIPISLPITSRCEIPNIVCLKLLEDLDGISLIKIPAKRNTRMPPLPFKNLSGSGCILQVETITKEDMSERAYDVSCQSSVNCSANSPFFVMLQLKPNQNYTGVTPKTDTIRKVLILKVRNSSLYYSYPIEVLVYDSSTGSSVS